MPDARREPACSTRLMFGRADRSAGASPHIIAVSSATTAGEEQDARVERNMGRDRHRRRRLQPASDPASAQRPSRKPVIDAVTARSAASTASWRVTALRLAPSADAQRDFLLAIDRASQQQLADVDARDQQHDADRREQQQERGPRRADDRLPAPARPRACVRPARQTTTCAAAAGCSTGRDEPLADHVEIDAARATLTPGLSRPTPSITGPGRVQPARRRKLRGGNEHVARRGSSRRSAPSRHRTAAR